MPPTITEPLLIVLVFVSLLVASIILLLVSVSKIDDPQIRTYIYSAVSLVVLMVVCSLIFAVVLYNTFMTDQMIYPMVAFPIAILLLSILSMVMITMAIPSSTSTGELFTVLSIMTVMVIIFGTFVIALVTLFIRKRIAASAWREKNLIRRQKMEITRNKNKALKADVSL